VAKRGFGMIGGTEPTDKIQKPAFLKIFEFQFEVELLRII
jgi:hypothetical protein